MEAIYPSTVDGQAGDDHHDDEPSSPPDGRSFLSKMTRSSLHHARIAFRVDASIEIGTGHVMRCLTLADAWRGLGAKVTFITRPHEGHLVDLVRARGHEPIVLSEPVEGRAAADGNLAHGRWLGVNWRNDAQETMQALEREYMDWLIVDHYGLDQKWEQILRPHCRRMMVIDDLADRMHECDLLLDQNLGRSVADYYGLISPGTRMLLGPSYALLRPEFAVMRNRSISRRLVPQFKHILITMGGVDKKNVTGDVLRALEQCELPEDSRVTVVLGPHAPWLEDVLAQANRSSRLTSVKVGISDMATLMSEADIAIGAAGSTSWERCCLGLPTIQFVLADNQKRPALALQSAKAAILVKSAEEARDFLKAHLDSQGMSSFLREMALAAAAVTNGRGAGQVVDEMMKYG